MKTDLSVTCDSGHGRRRGLLPRVILGSLLALGLAASASAKNFVITIPENGLTVKNPGKLFADSFSFTLKKATTLDFDWGSKNLFLDVVLFKPKTSTVLDQVFAPSGSFAASLGPGKYVLDFFGAKLGKGRANYHFSVLAVPEADTAAMLILGVALVGYQLRRRHKLLPRQTISAG